MRRPSLALLSGFFTFAGVMHFVRPRYYEAIVPPYVPMPSEVVVISGVAEVAGGIGLALPRTRRPSGWGLLALLAAVFPANLHMALHPEQFRKVHPALLWLRLPLQPLMMLWVWRASLRRS